MSDGRASRQKGDRFEREIVARARAAGFDAARVPLSGAAGGDFSGDIEIKAFRKLNGECKKRARGFGQIYDWLGADHDFLVIGRDRSEPLTVIPYSMFLALLRGVKS